MDCCLRPPLEVPEDTIFSMTVRGEFVGAGVGESPSILEMSSLITRLCRPELRVATVAPDLGNLNVKRVIGLWGGRDPVVALNYQRQGRCGYHNG